ncbi:hypothetical protein N658DRAFT_359984 [Parathielavia hyrcaniae]|uniref:Uncharacterized protein n=1 Tax=Parathielavia hyrcaniae TaxID=113614 RepID=A0AAN6Q2E1_9PEZI|nr:hypothetical protein N658DRAFT_359984 [Parathielavia hyrcaniae]
MADAGMSCCGRLVVRMCIRWLAGRTCWQLVRPLRVVGMDPSRRGSSLSHRRAHGPTWRDVLLIESALSGGRQYGPHGNMSRLSQPQPALDCIGRKSSNAKMKCRTLTHDWWVATNTQRLLVRQCCTSRSRNESGVDVVFTACTGGVETTRELVIVRK